MTINEIIVMLLGVFIILYFVDQEKQQKLKNSKEVTSYEK
jgi:hypothetical protein